MSRAHPAVQGVFRERERFDVIFSFVPFLLPNKRKLREELVFL